MNDNIDAKIIKNYDMIKKVGKGAYGQVWKCINKKTYTTCALKRIFDAFRNSTDCQRTYRQIMYLKQLNHHNIVKLLSYYKSHNEKDMYIEMEFVESDLSAALKNDYLKDIQKQYIFTQIVSAIYYLHSGHLIHRDIKPSNILVGANCQAKICDFGLIRSILHRDDCAVNRLNGEVSCKLTDNIATRWYKAPQLLLSSGNYGKQIDIWSLGCLLGQIYLGKPIFQGNSTYNQLQKIIQITGAPNLSQIAEFIQSQTSLTVLSTIIQKMNETKLGSKKCSNSSIQASGGTTRSKSTSSLLEYESNAALKDEYRKLIQMIPSLQPQSLHQASSNLLVLDLLSKILQFDPRKRLTIEQIAEHPYLQRFRNKIEFKKMSAPASIRYEHIKLNKEDYKLLLSEGSENIEINLSKYSDNRNSEKSREKINPQKSIQNSSSKFIPSNSNNDRSSSATKPQPIPFVKKQDPFHNYSASKECHSIYSGHSKRSNNKQESPPDCQSPKAATASNYRVIHLKDSAIVGYNKIIQNHNILKNQATTYYNNNINTTYIQTNYVDRPAQNMRRGNQHGVSPKSSTYVIHNNNMSNHQLYNSNTFHHPDPLSLVSNTSTNKHHIYNINIYSNANTSMSANATDVGVNGEFCKSQKSVSINKSDNKSVSGVSCKSYKSNVSRVNDRSKISNIINKPKTGINLGQNSKQRTHISPGSLNINDLNPNPHPNSNALGNGLVNINSTTSQSYKYITRNNYTSPLVKQIDRGKERDKVTTNNKVQNQNYIPNNSRATNRNEFMNINKFKCSNTHSVFKNLNSQLSNSQNNNESNQQKQQQPFNYRQSIEKNLNIIDKIRSDNQVLLNLTPTSTYHQANTNSLNALPDSDLTEKNFIGQTIRTDTETNTSIITSMHESKISSKVEYNMPSNNPFQSQNFIINMYKQPNKNSIFYQPQTAPNSHFKSPFNYHYPTLQPSQPTKPASNLNTSVNSSYLPSQMQNSGPAIPPRHYPVNTAYQYPNTSSNFKVNHPYTPHQNISNNMNKNMQSTLISPFSIKNGVPLQNFGKIHQNIVKIKPNQLRKS